MKPLKVLILEDSPLDVTAILKTLSALSFETECTVTSTGREYTDKMNGNEYDLILCDYQLSDFDAVKALQLRNQKNGAIPFILITGAVSEDVAISVLKEGADDYILKDRMGRLPFAIEKAIRKKKIKSDKQSIEASLSQLTERFQLAAKTSFDVIWDYHIQNNTVYCSPAIERIIGTPSSEHFPPGFLKTFIHSDDLLAFQKSFLAIIKGKENRWRKIFRAIHKNGSVVWVNTNAMVIRDKNEKAVRVVGVVHDVTEVRRLQHQIIEQELQNQKQMTEITVQAQERERTEIGKELHDNVNQLLATAKIMIDTARNIPELRDVCLCKSQESIMEAINELRNMAHAMMPPPFEKNDFEDILFDLAYKFNLTGKFDLKLSLPSKEKLATINNQVKLALYRIIQEQMSNVLKYSKAQNAIVTLNVDGSYYTLIVEDNGIGFNPDKKTMGIGLKNIESRCNILGGTMDVITAPGKGCTVRVRLPAKNTVYV